MRLKVSEKEIQKTILDYLHLRGIFAWRNNTGAFRSVYNGKERFHRFGTPGSGDILGLTKQGKFFSIEVKAPGNKVTPDQERFMTEVRANQGIAFVAYSVDDVEAFI